MVRTIRYAAIRRRERCGDYTRECIDTSTLSADLASAEDAATRANPLFWPVARIGRVVMQEVPVDDREETQVLCLCLYDVLACQRALRIFPCRIPCSMPALRPSCSGLSSRLDVDNYEI